MSSAMGTDICAPRMRRPSAAAAIEVKLPGTSFSGCSRSAAKSPVPVGSLWRDSPRPGHLDAAQFMSACLNAAAVNCAGSSTAMETWIPAAGAVPHARTSNDPGAADRGSFLPGSTERHAVVGSV